MSLDHDDRLRRAFAAGSERAAGPCPDADRLWAAASGELPPAERRALIDHTARCAACAEDFRIVAALVRAAPAARPAAPAAQALPFRARPAGRRLLGALAAMLLLGVLIAGLLGRRPAGPPEVYRGGEAAIVSLLGEPPALARGDAVLRWKGPQGARFAVTVTTADLRLVASAADLTESSYRLPPEALREVPAGAPLDWRVDALLPDGRQIVSPLFRFRLEN